MICRPKKHVNRLYSFLEEVCIRQERGGCQKGRTAALQNVSTQPIGSKLFVDSEHMGENYSIRQRIKSPIKIPV